MLTITKPLGAKYDHEKRVSTLVFDDKKSIAPSGKYFMRGGICFPTLCEDTVRGYAVMTGTNIKTQKTYIFDEFQFVCIDHILNDETQCIEHKGASQFFNKMWNEYYARQYFFNQDYTLQRRYRLQIARSPMIDPKPSFMELPWKDEDQSINAIFEKESFGRLFYKKEGGVFADMKFYSAKSDKVLPALHALKCALNGLEKYRIKDLNDG